MVCRGERRARAGHGLRSRNRQAGDAPPSTRSQRRGQHHHRHPRRVRDTSKGDLFFLPAGRVRGLGAGAFVAEIRQTSDITYRIYDFNRKDADGNTRELHTELAKGAIDYTVLPDYRTKYEQVQDRETELVSCPYFTTSLCDLTAPLTLDYAALDSFVVVICVEGKGMIADDSGNEMPIHQGETVLLPATVKSLRVVPEGKAQNADQLHQVNGMHSDR